VKGLFPADARKVFDDMHARCSTICLRRKVNSRTFCCKVFDDMPETQGELEDFRWILLQFQIGFPIRVGWGYAHVVNNLSLGTKVSVVSNHSFGHYEYASTVVGDQAEVNALKKVFKNRSGVKMNSAKAIASELSARHPTTDVKHCDKVYRCTRFFGDKNLFGDQLSSVGDTNLFGAR
ncbi:hypothetical protein Droror1_Dr00026995, partial [Drosera rotundifolia]